MQVGGLGYKDTLSQMIYFVKFLIILVNLHPYTIHYQLGAMTIGVETGFEV